MPLHNYIPVQSFAGDFVEVGGSFNGIGSSYSFNPYDINGGATVSSVSLSLGSMVSIGLSYDYYVPIFYWEKGG